MSLRNLLPSENAGTLTELSLGAFIRKLKLFYLYPTCELAPLGNNAVLFA